MIQLIQQTMMRSTERFVQYCTIMGESDFHPHPLAVPLQSYLFCGTFLLEHAKHCFDSAGVLGIRLGTIAWHGEDEPVASPEESIEILERADFGDHVIDADFTVLMLKVLVEEIREKAVEILSSDDRHSIDLRDEDALTQFVTESSSADYLQGLIDVARQYLSGAEALSEISMPRDFFSDGPPPVFDDRFATAMRTWARVSPLCTLR